MTKDYQRQKVYDWESSMKSYHNYNLPDMTTKECQKFATQLWNKYKNKFVRNYSKTFNYCSLVKVKKVNGYTSSMYRGLYFLKRKTKDGRECFYKKMHLSIVGHNKKVVIHEIAHALAPETSWHDDKFVGIVVYLYAKYLNYNLKYMVKTLNEKNIDFNFNFSKPLKRRIEAILKRSL
tara:strand:- start:10 stop:543 length:534 start_codon:yes stop_codon:yes gene_type:complete